MTISVPVIIFSNCTFTNLTFGSVAGAIHAIFEALSVRAGKFSETQSLVGIFKFTNRQQLNTALFISIQNTILRGNIAPYSLVLSGKDSAIDLRIDKCNFSNNSFKTESPVFVGEE